MISKDEVSGLREKFSEFWEAVLLRLQKPARLAAAVSALAGIVFIVLQWLSHYSPILAFLNSLYLVFFVVLVLGLLLVSLPLAPFLLAGLLLPKARKSSALALLLGYAAIATAYGSMMIGERVHLQPYAAMTLRSKPLIAAIQAYVTKYRQPPERLDDLVPEFLDRIPRTGIGASPKYILRRYLPDSADYLQNGGNSWVLEVGAGRMFSHSFMVYYPLQNFPPSDRGVLERINGWAYVRQ